jgi:hypothetical protein
MARKRKKPKLGQCRKINAAWIAKQESMAGRRLARRSGRKQRSGTLFAKKNRNLAMLEAALREVLVIINYTKITTGETKKYVVEPYEWKFRMLKSGFRKMLWAYDVEEQRIKSFVNVNIQNVTITDKDYQPQWPVKIHE